MGSALAGFSFAAIDGGQENLRVDTVQRTLRRHLLHGADAAILVAMKADQESAHFIERGQAADHIVVQPLHQARIHVGRLQFAHPIVQLARVGGVVQRAHPILLNQEEPVGAQAISDSLGVQRAGVIGIAAQTRQLQIEGLLDFA